MAAAQEAENHGDEIFHEGYIHQFQPEPFKKFNSSRSTKFKDILPWNISQMITKTIPRRTRIVINCDEMGHPVVN